MAKRPNILKLATKISLESMTYTGITYNDPEYKILEPIIDDEMCAIMMHLRLEANRTVEDVAKRAKQSVEYTQTQLDKLAKTGAVRYRYVDGKRCYFYPIWVPGIMEGILANREQCDKYPVLGESFEAYTRRRPEMLAPMLDSGKTGMFFMRVMPVMSAIENDTRTASYDELKTLIENATAISVGPCSCRRPAASWARAAATLKRTCACTSTTTPSAIPSRAITGSSRRKKRMRSSAAPRTTVSCTRSTRPPALRTRPPSATAAAARASRCASRSCSARRAPSARTTSPAWTRKSASPAASASKTARPTRSSSARSAARPIRTFPIPTTPTPACPTTAGATTRNSARTARTSCPAAPRRARPFAR